MSQYSADLEADLVNEGSSPTVVQQADDVQLLNPSLGQSDEPPQRDTNIAETSLIFNATAFTVPVPKILVSIYVLMNSDSPCVGPKQVWLLCMIAHDFLHAYIIKLRIRNIVASRNLEMQLSRAFGQNPNENMHNGVQGSISQEGAYNQNAQSHLNDEERVLQLQANSTRFQASEILETKATITRLTSICTYFWIFLFFFWVGKGPAEQITACESQSVNDLIFIYVLIGWIWLLNPLFICLAGCVCIPLLVVFICFFRKRHQQAASMSEIKKLTVKEYTSDLPGNKECAICLADYEEGDKILQLNCSTMHHFHEACGISWLKVNSQCPICRTNLGQARANSTNANV